MKFANFAFLLFLVYVMQSCGCTVVQPGNRGIKVTMGEVDHTIHGEGLVFHTPFVASVENVSVRQQTSEMVAECYSADLQQVNANLKVLYRIPEANVLKLFQDYSGNPFDSLIVPRVNEALKEITALESAESIVKNREKIKQATLASAKLKVGDLVMIEDIVIENVSLSKELESAIEQKMVQEQEAAKAKFTQQKATIEAETALIQAQGEANAISVRGKAIKENPGLVELMIAEKWNGVAPLVVGGDKGSNLLLPLGSSGK